MHRARALALLLTLPAACATESHRKVAVEHVQSHATPYAGPRMPIVVGRFENGSTYLRGVFSDGQDRLGSQARTILKTHLAESGRFTVMDRDNLEETGREAEIAGGRQTLSGADVIVTGEVTEFGRRETGDKELYGIIGRGRSQLAYSKVALNVIDVSTSQVVHTVWGAGEYELGTREVLGFGSTASYDSTLNGKVLNLAITDAVEKLVTSLEKVEWQPAKHAEAAR